MRGPLASCLPEPTSTVEAALEGGGKAPVRRYGNPDGPRLLMSHGNGLAIDLYYQFWSLLLDDFDLILFDLRNHGANPPGDLALHTIPAFCRDLEAVGQAVDRAFGVRPRERASIYHSVSCLAAALSPSLSASCVALVSLIRCCSTLESVSESSNSPATRRRREPGFARAGSGPKGGLHAPGWRSIPSAGAVSVRAEFPLGSASRAGSR